MRNIIHAHNVLQTPWPYADQSVDCIVTSPPYWGLRDYKHADQLGMENTPELYIDHLVAVFTEARRVLKDWGILWLNLGDTYWGGKGQSGASWKGEQLYSDGQNIFGKGETRPQDGRHSHIKPKDLVGIPWMAAFALRAAGWYLRQDIIWSKPNPMPESVSDRCTKSHEYIFLLTKSRYYFYDFEAIKEEAVYANSGRSSRQRGEFDGKTNVLPGREAFRAITETRNKRSVWTVATMPYEGAHFACFPPDLIVDCIKAGTSAKGNCPECGRPWERVTEPIIDVSHTGESQSQYEKGTSANRLAMLRQAARDQGMEYTSATRTVGWKPQCDHHVDEAQLLKPIILDPFMGAGTTALVSISHGRDFAGLELNPEYISLAQQRLRDELGMFSPF